MVGQINGRNGYSAPGTRVFDRLQYANEGSCWMSKELFEGRGEDVSKDLESQRAGAEAGLEGQAKLSCCITNRVAPSLPQKELKSRNTVLESVHHTGS